MKDNFKPSAIIFDKDGTLIDFDLMWGGWTEHLANQLHQASQLDVFPLLCHAFGYDPLSKNVFADGKLAAYPMQQLCDLTVEVMRTLGLNHDSANKIVKACWCVPDPVLLAKPFTDLDILFNKLQNENIKIAIATADDHIPTQAMIDAFDIENYIDAFICADDGVKSKPAPDMALEICKRINIEPSKVIVIGDTVSDMKMGHAAGVGLCVGVLSGVSSAKDLIPHADLIIESIDELHIYLEELSNQPISQNKNGLNPDFAF